ncbi:ubiquitin-conjugating enzyme E2 S [Pectinophora gossypiella]|uniref:ubiquitin-conjugating enzyme E2 S n=1 Tax=Pectinophora gossypiella TaxID=13191 RepID=UPI00214E55D6|nr:ubiquitin-conjugating enzyme E2 S [Pectinophora gossypiella]
MGSEENVCPQAWGGRGAIAREVRRLAARPPSGVKLLLQDDDLSQLTALIAGPADTPYAGGSFRVRLALGGGYPARPPRAVFETRIFHPNVSAAGEVCVNTLARDWRPELGLAHALLAVRCLLIAPNPDSALNAEAAALLRDDYAEYFARARLYTDIHALPDSQAEAGPAAATAEAGAATAEAGAEAGATATGGAGGASKRRAAGPRARDKRRILKRL